MIFVQNNKGTTLVELMVSIGVAGILLVVVSQTFIGFSKFSNNLDKSITNSTDRETAMKFVRRDLALASPSMNNLSLKDDSQKIFFDFLPGCPARNRVSKQALRSITLSKASKRKKVSFLIIDPFIKMPLVVSPANCYKVSSPDPDPEKGSKISFASLNKGSQLTKQHEKVWNEGRFIYLHAPVWIKTNLNAQCSERFPKKQPSYLGKVAGQRLQAFSGSLGFNFKDPSSPRKSFTSEDVFLRKLPGLGGASPMVLARAASIVTYILETNSPNYDGRNVLYREINDGVGESHKHLIGIGVKEFILKRSSLVNPMIDIEIITEERRI